jgi:predicted anti-sigma-YlaC factor YlaD
MTCRELIDFLDDYLAGTQPDDVRQVFEGHLAICLHCREYLRTYRDTVSLVKAACSEPDTPLPADAPPELVEAILAAVRKR